jgi:hypothetical protein
MSLHPRGPQQPLMPAVSAWTRGSPRRGGDPAASRVGETVLVEVGGCQRWRGRLRFETLVPAQPHPVPRPISEIPARIEPASSRCQRSAGHFASWLLLPIRLLVNQSSSRRSSRHTDGPQLRSPRQCHACPRSLTRKQSRLPKLDSRGDSNAVTSATVHRASLRPAQVDEHPLRRFAGFS